MSLAQGAGGRRRTSGLPLLLACAMLTAVETGAHPASSGGVEEVVQLPFSDGVQWRILYDAPEHPRATLVMLSGGTGDIGIEVAGGFRHGNNFVVRTRETWVAKGYAVVIPDAVDHANLRGLRSSPAYGRLVDRLASFARSRAKIPVFLLGTSQGSIAAVSGAVTAPPGLLAGVILTESVSVQGGSGETVFDARPAEVRVPVLIVANTDDRCPVAPPADAPRIAAALRNAPDMSVVEVQGGINADGRPCGSLSPHGYNGIETEVVGRIAAWIDKHS